MPTLNFPTSPSVNQLYSFGGKTWIWTGTAWRLNPTGAINNIPIGNVTPSTGAFTTLTANTFSANTLSVTNLDVPGNLSVGGHVASPLQVVGNVSATGNVSGTYFLGNGSQLTGINVSGGTSINNGASNVKISTENANVTVGVAGTDVAEFSATELNIAGDIVPAANGVYSLGSSTNAWKDIYVGGNSIYLGNIVLSNQAGNLEVDGNAVLTSAPGGNTSISGNVVVAGNVVADNFIGNISGNLTIDAANTEIIFSNNGVAVGSPHLTFDDQDNILSVAGNVVAANFQGNGAELENVMSDRGSDQNDWNTLIQMGVYTVNRTSWSGTTGTPLDSQVFVGLLEVKNSSNVGIVQVYSPGTVENTNVKIQWDRSYWAGTWTQWVKMTNDQQNIDGGGF